SRRRHTRFSRDWSSDVCSSDLAQVWQQQLDLLARRIEGSIGDTLLLVEHEPVYTWGKRTPPEHMGAGTDALRALGADTFEVERRSEERRVGKEGRARRATDR